MNVRDLLDLLEDLDPETEVRLAHQPSWPMEYRLDGASVVSTDVPADDDEPDCDGDVRFARTPMFGEDATPVVWLAEGSQIGYLPGVVSERLGWR